MESSSLRRYGLLSLTILLLIITAVKHWPSKSTRVGSSAKTAQNPPPMPPPTDGFPPPDPAMQARFENALRQMPPEKRQAIETRMQADRTFFDSVRNLPEDQRRERIQEYFKSNPPLPPPDFEPGSVPPPMGGPPGPPGGGPPNGPMRIPDPAIRRTMDQQIANSQSR
jgi:hypothetical protein